MKELTDSLSPKNLFFPLKRFVYLLGLATILCGLGWSNILMSIGQLLILTNWLIDLNFKEKWISLTKNKTALILLSLIILHFIGLLWTSDYSYGFRDILKKLPLLLLPVIFATTKPLSKKELTGLSFIYLSTLFILTFASYLKLFGITADAIIDKRELSINISHIRYGLNIAFAIFICYYALKIGGKNKWIFAFLIMWFFGALIAFELYTGLISLLITSLILAIHYILNKRISWIYKILPLIIALSFSLYGIIVFINVYKDYKVIPKLNYDQENYIPRKSAKGNYYWNEKELDIKENGVYVYRFIARKEVKKQWNKLSDFDFDGLDKKGQKIETTIYRFMSSKGIIKDSVGVHELIESDIKAIENGIANIYYLEHNAIENRLHKSLYEFENYTSRGIVSGFSLAMRIEYWKTAIKIIRKNILIGVGTGDVKDAFQKQYEEDKSSLKEQYRRRAHNQYLTFTLTFGIIGLVVFILFLFYPIGQIGFFKHPIYTSFFIIAVLSFITEDTLETQAGVTFFALFNCLLLLGYPKDLKFPDI